MSDAGRHEDGRRVTHYYICSHLSVFVHLFSHFPGLGAGVCRQQSPPLATSLPTFSYNSPHLFPENSPPFPYPLHRGLWPVWRRWWDEVGSLSNILTIVGRQSPTPFYNAFWRGVGKDATFATLTRHLCLPQPPPFPASDAAFGREGRRGSLFQLQFVLQ